MLARIFSVAVAASLAISCRKPETHAEAVAPEASEDPPAPKKKTATAGTRDLTAQGLPLVIDVPACATVAPPTVKLGGNAHDLILACEPSGDAPAFAIQVGHAAGKTWKNEMQGDPNFKRWIKTDANFIHAELTQFTSTVQDFAYKTKVNNVEYMCFNQLSSADDKLVASMIAACRSLRAP
jgi:hypothetical protein